jgi:hypothetical protein
MNKLAKNQYPLNGKIEYNYNYTPKTSFIINYFTSVDTLLKTINNIRCLGDEIEIIIINDHWGVNTDKIMKVLTNRNDRMIISRDLGERRGYHHGALISISSDFLIFCQDDDLAPNNNNWYIDCMNEFNKDKDLGMIGLLKGGVNYAQKDNKTFMNEYDKMYVSWLATGPLVIRKDIYFSVNGWSNEYSQIGEADGGADADLATKVLLLEKKVMLLRTKAVKEWIRRFQRNDDITNENIKLIRTKTDLGILINKRIYLNNDIYYNKYKDIWDKIYYKVKEYNKNINIYI